MNSDDPQLPDRSDDNALDQLLAKAQWPTLSPTAMNRLRSAARHLPSSVVWQITTLAAAAAILVLCWIGVRRLSAPDSQPRTVAITPVAPQIPMQAKPIALERASSPAEMLLVLPPAPGRQSASANAVVNTALSQLRLGYPHPFVVHSLRPFANHSYLWSRIETELSRDPARAPQLASLIAQLATPARRAELARHYQHVALRDALLPAVVRVFDERELMQMLANETDFPRRRTIVAAMVARDRDGQLTLALAMNPDTLEETLIALRHADSPAVAPLLAALRDSSPSRRLAAARALGTLCHAGVLPQLERMVLTGEHRREAITALLCCRDGAADDIVKRVSQDASIAALVRTVANEINGSI